MGRADLLFLLAELADSKIHVESVYGGSNRDSSTYPFGCVNLWESSFQNIM